MGAVAYKQETGSIFHVHGKYEGELPKVTFVNGEFNPNGLNRSEAEEIVAPSPIEITYGYSRDHRPDLKQFILDLIRTTRSLSTGLRISLLTTAFFSLNTSVPALFRRLKFFVKDTCLSKEIVQDSLLLKYLISIELPYFRGRC